jgi:phage shock protein PspC (stress-responsive transcriptional regulator)
MKRTLTINLNNIVFHIDDDAYEMLLQYLTDIAQYFESEEEKKEIMSDIEARISELFSEKLQKGKNVITIDDVKDVIQIMGKPNEYAGEEEKQVHSNNQKSEKKGTKTRRFYRDPENCILGGVASGLAAYIDWDVTLIRVLMVIGVFIGMGVIIPIYIVMWLVSPEAKTPSQRLEMQGEEVNIESIKSEFNNIKSYVKSEDFKESAHSIGYRLQQLIRLLIKPIVAIIGAIFGLVTIIAVICIVALLGFLIFNPESITAFNYSYLTPWTSTPENYLLLLISILLIIGCPVFMIFFWAIRFARGNMKSSRLTSWLTFLLWLAGLFMLVSVSSQSIHYPIKNCTNHLILDKECSDMTKQIRNLEKFQNIEIEGHIELNIVQDTIQKVVICSQERYQNSIVTNVVNGTLWIKTEGVSLNRISKVILHIDTLQSISAKGACNINCTNQLITENLKIKIMGTSEATFDAKISNTIDITTKGASDLTLSGTCKTFKLNSAGASSIKAQSMISENSYVELAGASDAKVYASKIFDGEAMGVSHIKCYGHPKEVNKDEHFTSSIIMK